MRRAVVDVVAENVQRYTHEMNEKRRAGDSDQTAGAWDDRNLTRRNMHVHF